MQNLQQIQFLAANYSRLQGLKAIPYGLGLLLVTVWANLRKGPRTDLLLPVTILLAMVGLIYLADQYYKSHYGRTQPTRRQKLFDFLQGILGGLVGLGAFLLDVSPLHLPVSFIGLVFSGAFLAEYLRMRRMTNSRYLLLYPILALLMLVGSLSPILGLNRWWLALGLRSSLFGVMLIVSVLMMIGGLVGHIYLTRLLPGGGSHGRGV